VHHGLGGQDHDQGDDRALLATRGPVLKTEGNLNNQYGLPLMLLRLRRSTRPPSWSSGCRAGELRELSGIARPDVAVITLVAAGAPRVLRLRRRHRRGQGEILEGLAEGGTAVLNGDDRA
jgi:UDP-N-acetylmuramoyl-tripeptide--D-alanyl-D-alanine ligase